MEKVLEVKDKLKTLNNRSQKKQVTFGGSIVNVKDARSLFGGSIVEGGTFRRRISIASPGTVTLGFVRTSLKSVVRPPAA